ncbi:MAG TPA: cytosine deaminase [Stellaceae bacterium]|jgi:cytosine deaminase|nr:cytosine deaminase [Stellaceae bacterium]
MEAIPIHPPFRLADAGLPPGVSPFHQGQTVPIRVDIDIDSAGLIAAIHDAGTTRIPGPVVHLGGRMVLPGLVDAHAHIDKSHTWGRAPNPDGTLRGARDAAKADRLVQWSFDDVHRRMDFAIRTAYTHGTVALRTHIDSQEDRAQPSWAALARLRRDWQGRMIIQGVTTLGIHKLSGPWGETIADLAADHGAILGPVVYDGPALDDELDRAFDLAETRGLDLDFHVDETADPGADGLTKIADAMLRRGFKGKVTCDHACSLAQRDGPQVARTIRRVKEAGIGVVSLPMTNIYLMDRGRGRTPRWRGITLVQELKAGGVKVALAGDNVRDAFHPYGDHDMLDVFRDALRLGHLDMPIGDWPGAICAVAADILGLKDTGRIDVGLSADLVIFQGRDYSEVLARHGLGRIVLRRGQAIDTTPPDYRELDDLH